MQLIKLSGAGEIPSGSRAPSLASGEPPRQQLPRALVSGELCMEMTADLDQDRSFFIHTVDFFCVFLILFVYWFYQSLDMRSYINFVAISIRVYTFYLRSSRSCFRLIYLHVFSSHLFQFFNFWDI